MTRLFRARIVASVLSVAVLAACGGGGRSTPVPALPKAETPAQQLAQLSATGAHFMPTTTNASRAAAHGSGRRVKYYSGPGDLINHGGPVQSRPAVILVLWGFNAADGDPSGEGPYLQSFLGAVGGTTYWNTMTQYGMQNGSILAAVINDNSAVPASPSQADVENTVRRNAWYYGGGTNLQYVVATPHNHNTPGFSTNWCAFHSYTNNNPGKFGLLYYTDLPYNTDAGNCYAYEEGGALDGVSHVAGHEVAETVTDPHWYDGWVGASNYEIGDKCTGPGQHQKVNLNGTLYAVQPLYSNADHDCVFAYTPPPPCTTDSYGYCVYDLGATITPTQTCADGTQLYQTIHSWELYHGSTDQGTYSYQANPDCYGNQNDWWSPGEPSVVTGDPNLP